MGNGEEPGNDVPDALVFPDCVRWEKVYKV